MSLVSLPYDLVELTAQHYLSRREHLRLTALHSALHEVCQPLLYRVLGNGKPSGGFPHSAKVFERYGHYCRVFNLDKFSQPVLGDVVKYCRNVRVLNVDTPHPLDLADSNVFPRLTDVNYRLRLGTGVTLRQFKDLVVSRVEGLTIKQIDTSLRTADLAVLLKKAYAGGGLKRLKLDLLQDDGLPIEQVLVNCTSSTLQTLDIWTMHTLDPNNRPFMFGGNAKFPNLKSLSLPACCHDRYSFKDEVTLSPEEQFPNVTSLRAFFSFKCHTATAKGVNSKPRGSPYSALCAIWSVCWPSVRHLDIAGVCVSSQYPVIAKNFPALTRLSAKLGRRFVSTGPLPIGLLVEHFHHLDDIYIQWNYSIYNDNDSDTLDSTVIPRIRKIRIQYTPVPVEILAELLVSRSLRDVDVCFDGYDKLAKLLEKKRSEEGKVSQVTSFVVYKNDWDKFKASGLSTLLPRCRFTVSSY
ncbi:hypothetical protein GQ42DRAFT_164881 [Ramicandelaber brevisporus]|nr:hypothetical protein GQ42DRAFT_164881 [Ramicandelaber brevisporus]